MRHFLILATAFALTGSAVPAQEASPHPDTNGFFEDFTGKLNKDRWYVSDGWSNGDWQDCVWSGRAVQVRGGILTLFHIPKPEGREAPPLCGEVRTKAFFSYGTFEARIRTPRQSGMNASVFTYTGPAYKAPHDEIDIEILTRNPDRMTMNTFVSGKATNGEGVPATPGFDSDFHTVGFRWAPDGITWFMDGREVHRTAPGTPLPENPQRLYMSFWSTMTLTDWMGPQMPQDKPLGYDIDWVAYTPLTASCLFPASISCEKG